MKTLTVILLAILSLSGCDEDKKDYFIGDWKYKNTSADISVTFSIKKNGNTYIIANALLNDLRCEDNRIEDAKAGKFIEEIVILNEAEIKGLSFINCKTFGMDKITIDTVSYIIGTGANTPSGIEYVLYFNQTLIKI